jgi:hypothetical protein
MVLTSRRSTVWRDKMSANESTDPTPHRFAVDLAPLEGVKVLGEPLDVLYSALLRVRFGAERDGLMEASATWPQHEAEAFQRAMARSEPAFAGDRRTAGQRDCDRFLSVAMRVCEVTQAVMNARSRGAA